MATEVKTESNSASSDYHTPRTVEDVTERNVQAILQLEQAARANRSNAEARTMKRGSANAVISWTCRSIC